MTISAKGPARGFMRALRSERGGAAVTAAYALPVLLMLAGGATDMQVTSMKRVKLQNALDAAVLAGAKADNSAAVATAEQVFAANKGDLNVRPVFVADGDRVRSSINMPVPTSFLTAIGVETLPARASAVAFSGKVAPFCVLMLEPSNTGLLINSGSKLDARVCGVQVNSNGSGALTANRGGEVYSESLCVHGRVVNNQATIQAPAQTGCPRLSDPFAAMAAPSVPTPCPNRIADRPGVPLRLPAGCHGDITAQNRGRIEFQPGIHRITGRLIANSDTSISGSDVLLYFSGSGSFTLNARSSMTLTGLETGPYAGFVMWGDRGGGTTDFILNADVTGTLEGTVYLPRGNLVLNSDVTSTADYTVIVANKLDINHGAAQVVRNSYNTDTPLPEAFRRVRLEG